MITRTRSSSSRRAVDGENPYWVSFSDIMAGLLVIFILALVTLMIQQKIETEKLSDAKEKSRKATVRAEAAEKLAKQKEIQAQKIAEQLNQETEKSESLRKEIVAGVVKLSEIEGIRIAILNEVAERLKEAGIRVVISENSTVLRIPEDTLAFETAKWDVPRESEDSLHLIGEAIHDAITKEGRLDYLDTIFVEGHTDSVPLQREMGNWGLSTYRAIAVWEFWRECKGPAQNLGKLRNHESRPVFSVSGYGETRRVIEKDLTDEERRTNRRIDLRFTMKSVQQSDLEALIDRFKR